VYNSALRVLLFQARAGADPANIRSGIELAGRVIAGELQCQHVPSALETLLLRSQLYAALGDEQNSLADALKALELAEPEGFASIFIEEGEAVRSLIADCCLSIEKTGQEKIKNYLDHLLGAFPIREGPVGEKQPSLNQPSAVQNLVEPLTKREMEVLHK
jgi:LuxR family maltose regulon positive regulatory protein